MATLAGTCAAADAIQPPPRVSNTIDPATGLPITDPLMQKRFDIDFKGGPPRLFVEVVEKAAGIPLNAIIPEEHFDFNLPPLKLRNVTLPQLFDALIKSSARVERYGAGPGGPFQTYTRSFGFKTSDLPPGVNSVWYFFVDGPAAPTPSSPKPICRFWQLEPYLDRLQVEDITTAIETGWKMLGVSPAPKLSFHKDTKLLIVVGEPEKLLLVDDVLRELMRLTPPIDPATGLPVPTVPKNKPQRPAGEKPSKQ